MNLDSNAVIAATVVLAIIIVLLLTTARVARARGIAEGRRQFAEAHRREQEAAVHLFLSRLNSLVTRPCEEDATASRARSIVGVVESFQNALLSITAPLGPENQQIKSHLRALSERPEDAHTHEQLLQTMSALREGWPDRRLSVETIVRQLLAQLSTIDTTPQDEHAP